ncbi:ATP-binding protein [Paenibacillus dendritiformis]|uniref:ATP-binding protein n=1 Tax=Paenibacillus dendritiformis TaxID=130049 RepID=UPI00143D481C|nr:ATP-binding protein [Paenibacillus dendritiformis]NKI22886.1 ATP-binding protein [Paenibacillus dendritiformis]NRF97888.1 ATP-binding protein [Paenibacillus dendritiformis]
MRTLDPYQQKIKIDISDFTAFIGKNDSGKSTVLEALEIFFNNSLVKIEPSDRCVYSADSLIRIGCVFSNVPDRIVIDATRETNLEKEMLLNSDGHLEIHKIYDASQKTPKESVYAVCSHPSHPKASDLMQLKIADLRKRLKELSIDESAVDLRSSSSIRKAIYNHIGSGLELRETEIPLNKEDAKSIWDALKLKLPIYALFQADRPSKDDDSEVQDPMKLAISEAIKQVQDNLNQIVKGIQKNVEDVANRTLAHLQKLDSTLAEELSPVFKSDPKWESLFKMSLTGDDSIPINKRGSGVRRLVLLSFFKAELERKRIKDTVPVIYAIEEPETSQHPLNQIRIIKSLLELSDQPNCQVIITTHVPALAGEIPTSSLRYIRSNSDGTKEILANHEFVFSEVANTLGVIAEPIINSHPILICVEGSNDVSFIKHISRLIHENNPSLPDLNTDKRVVILPLGGSTLNEWVKHRYLKNLGLIEIHIYDRDKQPPDKPKYSSAANAVNKRNDGSIAFITNKKELENYIHPACIREVMGLDISFNDFDDVPKMICEQSEMNESTIKKWLNDKVVKLMTYEQLCEMDPVGEITAWFQEIQARLDLKQVTLMEVAVSNDTGLDQSLTK